MVINVTRFSVINEFFQKVDVVGLYGPGYITRLLLVCWDRIE